MAWVNAIIQGVLTGGLYALFACGLSLMFGVMKVVNLAHGDLAVVAGYIAIGVIAVTHIPVLWSFVIVVPVMALIGYVLQRTVIQGALDRSVLTTLMVTFGLSVVIENGLLQFFTANSRAIGTGLPLVSGSFKIGSQIQIGYLLVVVFAVAEEITGFGHHRSDSIFKYISSTSGGGGLSLPFSHASRLGWALSRCIWSCNDADAISKSSSFQLPQCSQKSQQHHPAITRMPCWSAISKKSSVSSLPSSRTVFRPRSRT